MKRTSVGKDHERRHGTPSLNLPQKLSKTIRHGTEYCTTRPIRTDSQHKHHRFSDFVCLELRNHLKGWLTTQNYLAKLADNAYIVLEYLLKLTTPTSEDANILKVYNLSLRIQIYRGCNPNS